MGIKPKNHGDPKKSAAAPRQQFMTKIVSVDEFVLDGAGKAVGIKGKSFPDRSPITVTLTAEGPKAENPNRKDFDAYRKGFTAAGKKRVLEPGGILRLNCAEAGESAFAADWINVLSYNAESTKQSMSFGFTGVELAMTDIAKARYYDIKKEMTAENSNVGPYAVNDALFAELKGQKPYKIANVVQYHPGNIMDCGEDNLRDTLLTYYGDAKFGKVTSESGSTYEPVSPGLMVRALNAEGEILESVNVTSFALFKAGVETPEDRAAYVQKQVLESFSPEGTASYSLLPYDRRKISDLSMTVDDNTKQGIHGFVMAQRATSKPSPDGSGFEVHAVQAAIRSAENGMPTDIAIPHGAKSVNVALLARDGTELRVAASPQEEETESSGPCP